MKIKCNLSSTTIKNLISLISSSMIMSLNCLILMTKMFYITINSSNLFFVILSFFLLSTVIFAVALHTYGEQLDIESSLHFPLCFLPSEDQCSCEGKSTEEKCNYRQHGESYNSHPYENKRCS